jgi:hypothetical protein
VVVGDVAGVGRWALVLGVAGARLTSVTWRWAGDVAVGARCWACWRSSTSVTWQPCPVRFGVQDAREGGMGGVLTWHVRNGRSSLLSAVLVDDGWWWWL